ncbi:MAG: glycosyltransferase, partial [Lachnospiraceae bacterium]|nr:glycosyltransferase [Lachnospiraceae bacterium]
MRASVVIPNYNGLKFLPTCLASLALQIVTDFEVIVVD